MCMEQVVLPVMVPVGSAHLFKFSALLSKVVCTIILLVVRLVVALVELRVVQVAVIRTSDYRRLQS